MSSEGSQKVILFALLANFGIALAKFFGAWLTASAALLAEAVHSLVDCTNQILLWVGGKKAKKSPDARHPLGYGREAFFWSFMVAILLFSLGGVFAIYEGAHKLNQSGDQGHPYVAIVILGVSIVLEGFSFWACYKEVQKQLNGRSLWQWFQKTTRSELLVVFTEDLAALFGLFIALTCVILSWVTGSAAWDAIGSIAVGVLLVIVAILLASEVKSLLIGESPDQDFSGELDRVLKKELPGASLLKIIALQTGPSESMLAAKFRPPLTGSVPDLLSAMNRVESRMKTKFPDLKWQFLEPDTED